MARIKINPTLQESLITLLVHDDVEGKVLTTLVNPSLFEGDYRVIAERAFNYWHLYREAPKSHASDLVSDILDDPATRKAPTYQRLLLDMVELAPTINRQYVLNQVRTFVRLQNFKDTVYRTAELLQAQEEMALPEVEKLWQDILNLQHVGYTPGLRLTEVDRILNYLETQYTEFKLGIKEFDYRHVAPFRGGVILLLGGAGRGKTWGLIHAGRRAMEMRKKVLHVSLEMSEEEVAARYYQMLWAVPKRLHQIEDGISITGFRYDKKKLVGFDSEEAEPEFALDSKMVRDEVETRLLHEGRKIDNLMVKRYPPRSLSMQDLRAQLDTIEIVEGFVPDMLVLDYIGITKTNAHSAKDHRISLGRSFEEFRAVCIERNMAGVTAMQLSKAATFSELSNAGGVAEDWSLIATADGVLIYAATDQEFNHGLGRIYVGKMRSEEDRFGVLMTQNYKTGQFCIDSTMLHRASYQEMLKAEFGDDKGHKDGEEEDSEDDE